jgi:outer membrane protein assembly factor BamB
MRKIIIPILVLLAIALFTSGCTGVGIASSWPGITSTGDTIYTAYGQGVFAVSPVNGSVLWRYPEKAGKNNFYAAPLQTPDGQIVVGDYNNELHSMDAKTGYPRWTFKAEGRWVAQPEFSDGILYAPNADRNLYALDMNGDLVWKFKTENSLWAKPLVINGVVYLAGMDHYLYAIDSKTGQEIWKTDCGAAIIGNPVNANGSVYVGTLGNEVLSIKTSNGAVLWRYKTANGVWSGPSVLDGKLYFGDLDGNFHVITEEGQKLVWSYKADGALLGSPLLTESTIYFTTEKGSIIALDYTGKVIYTKSLSEKLYGTPVISGDNLLVGTTVKENILIALDSNGNQVWFLAQPK